LETFNYSFTIIIVEHIKFEIMKKRFTYLFIYILLFSCTVFGQIKSNKTPISKDSIKTPFKERIVEFNNDTKSEEIIINIKEQTPIFELMINSTINAGKLKVEVVDPAGITQGNFTVSANSTFDKGETTNGNISKCLKNPQQGDWKVKFFSIKANGKIIIKTNFENDYFIIVPKEFTPNGDGNNDILRLETYNISEIIAFKIFNRWGNLVFSSNKINKGWDGKLNGELQKSESYYYIVKAKTASGLEVTKNGILLLSK